MSAISDKLKNTIQAVFDLPKKDIETKKNDVDNDDDNNDNEKSQNELVKYQLNASVKSV